MEKSVLPQSYLKESLYERVSLRRRSISSSDICSNCSGDVPSREGGGIPWVSLQKPCCTHHFLHWHPPREMLKENGYILRFGWVPSLFTWNYHNIVNWLYANTKCFLVLKQFFLIKKIFQKGHCSTRAPRCHLTWSDFPFRCYTLCQHCELEGRQVRSQRYEQTTTLTLKEVSGT